MIDHEAKTFVLRALLTNSQNGGGPMRDENLKEAIRGRFPGVALTNGDMTAWLRALENSSLISGTRDDVDGVVWDLTTKGKIKAQQL